MIVDMKLLDSEIRKLFIPKLKNIEIVFNLQSLVPHDKTTCNLKISQKKS